MSRRDVLEEAARACEAVRGPHERNPYIDRSAFEDACDKCIDAISALAQQEPDEQNAAGQGSGSTPQPSLSAKVPVLAGTLPAAPMPEEPEIIRMWREITPRARREELFYIDTLRAHAAALQERLDACPKISAARVREIATVACQPMAGVKGCGMENLAIVETAVNQALRESGVDVEEGK